jgi:hypothetical protein
MYVCVCVCASLSPQASVWTVLRTAMLQFLLDVGGKYVLRNTTVARWVDDHLPVSKEHRTRVADLLHAGYQDMGAFTAVRARYVQA